MIVKRSELMRKFKILVVIILTFYTGFLLGTSKADDITKFDDEYTYFRLFADVVRIIKENYVEEPSTKKLIYGALNGMLHSLDPFSGFFDPDQYKEFRTETEGSFGGVGIEIGMEKGRPIVISPIEGTPAFKAGVRPGDIIIEIDGEDTFQMSLLDVVKKIRGKPGTEVELTLIRKGEAKPIKVRIKRAIIKIESVKYTKIDNIGYIKIVQFQEGTSRELERAIAKLEEEGINSLILDLRNNPGGLLSEAVNVADLFLGPDKLIVYTKGRGEETRRYYSQREALVPEDMDIVILINKGSASASEIVTGALQDYGRAHIVGEKSFGKASVQNIIPLEDGSAIKLTVAYYYTPKGRLIHKKGIEPDVIVELDQETAEKIANKVRELKLQGKNGVILLPDLDVQLRRAMDILKKKNA